MPQKPNDSPTALTPAATGVIFDQHYTDSLLRVALEDGKYRARLTLGPPVERSDVLLSLLLFDTAHVVEPFWLSGSTGAQEHLAPLQSDGLISLVPRASTEEAFRELATFVDKSLKLEAQRRRVSMISLDSSPADLRATDRMELEQYDITTNLEKDTELLLKRMQYIEPVIRASISNLGDASISIADSVDWMHYLDAGLNEFDLDAHSALDLNVSDSISGFLDASVDILTSEHFDRLSDMVLRPDIDGLGASEIDRETAAILVADAKRLRRALIGALTSMSCERYASRSKLPLRTSAAPSENAKLDSTLGAEAHQLFRIQFETLQYPVLESLDDVRRLRDSKHLRAYRSVLTEYSTRLRSELTEEKRAVLTQFKHDMLLANQDLRKLGRRMELFERFSWWISIPLFVYGYLEDIPVDDIVLAPVTQFAYMYAKRKMTSLDWLLLGKP